MIKKYMKKPVVVEAMQFTEESADEVVKWVTSGRYCSFDKRATALTITSLEGNITANLGDWIIKGVEGEFYPCKPSIFEKTYEIVDTFCGTYFDKGIYDQTKWEAATLATNLSEFITPNMSNENVTILKKTIKELKEFALSD